jgi:hypothetical protein
MNAAATLLRATKTAIHWIAIAHDADKEITNKTFFVVAAVACASAACQAMVVLGRVAAYLLFCVTGVSVWFNLNGMWLQLPGCLFAIGTAMFHAS